MFTRTILAAAAVLFVAGNGPGQDAKMELDKLQGEWKLVTMETKGKTVSALTLEKLASLLTIKGDQWQFGSEKSDKRATAALKIDPSKEPKTFDLTFKKGVRLGIYKLEGDTLTVCTTSVGSERPTAFKTTEKTGDASVEVWKRAKK